MINEIQILTVRLFQSKIDLVEHCLCLAFQVLCFVLLIENQVRAIFNVNGVFKFQRREVVFSNTLVNPESFGVGFFFTYNMFANESKRSRWSFFQDVKNDVYTGGNYSKSVTIVGEKIVLLFRMFVAFKIKFDYKKLVLIFFNVYNIPFIESCLKGILMFFKMILFFNGFGLNKIKEVARRNHWTILGIRKQNIYLIRLLF